MYGIFFDGKEERNGKWYYSYHYECHNVGGGSSNPIYIVLGPYDTEDDAQAEVDANDQAASACGLNLKDRS
jgi:hypothetical protein